MNIAEKYVYEVYRARSFTDAAKKMFISQPALSAAIIKHEAKLGYDIFDRKNNPISLTKEGEVYIDYLEDSMELEMKLKERLNSIHTDSSKKISIGGSNSAAFIAIPKICGEFSKRFPDVSINIDVGGTVQSNSIFDKLDKGILDVIITSNLSSQKYDYVTIWNEKYMLVIRKDYPGIEKFKDYILSYDEVLSGEYPKEKELADWNLFKQINIFKPGTNRKGWKIFSNFFSETSHEKCRIYNFRNLDMHYALMAEGLGATMLPQSTIIKNGYNPEKLCCFAIKAENNLREVMIAYKNASSLTNYTKEFIEIAKRVF